MSKFKFTWGHGIIVALGCFMIFIVTLVILGGNMGEMVDENYYEKTIKYQDEINAASRANALSPKPEIIQQANGYLLRFHQTQPDEGTVLFMRLNNSEDDIYRPLNLNSKNEQLIHSVDLINGDYEVTLRWKQLGQDFLIKQTINWEEPSL